MKEWIERAVLLDPDNLNMRYNLACVLIDVSHDNDAGLDMLAFVLERCLADTVNWMQSDADLDPVRDHPPVQGNVGSRRSANRADVLTASALEVRSQYRPLSEQRLSAIPALRDAVLRAKAMAFPLLASPSLESKPHQCLDKLVN